MFATREGAARRGERGREGEGVELLKGGMER